MQTVVELYRSLGRGASQVRGAKTTLRISRLQRPSQTALGALAGSAQSAPSWLPRSRTQIKRPCDSDSRQGDLSASNAMPPDACPPMGVRPHAVIFTMPTTLYEVETVDAHYTHRSPYRVVRCIFHHLALYRHTRFVFCIPKRLHLPHPSRPSVKSFDPLGRLT